MEAIKTTIENNPEQTQKFSNSQPISTTTRQTSQISRDQHAALFAIINKSRMLNGWTAKTAQELDATIRVWFEVLSHYKIPVGCFDRLYFRAVDTRQTYLMNGKEPPPLTAELMIAGWTGANGLQAELRNEEISRGRSLGENAESVCKHCHGTNWRTIKEEGYSFAKKCDHRN
jgi:hypothetical protein